MNTIEDYQTIIAQIGDINGKNHQGMTLLLCAMINEEDHCLRWLLENGSNPNISDDENTPL